MPTLRDTYRHGLSALLADADRLGRTPDDIAARVVVLAELRHAIAAGLGEEAPAEQPKPAKGRLVWGQTGSIRYLAPSGEDQDGAYYSTGGTRALRYPGGVLDYDRSEVVSSLAHGLRVITDLARADGYEVPDHPDAAPATAADAPTLPPPGLRAEDGWIPWGGGVCPCHDWPEVEYVCRNGYHGAKRPKDLLWEHNDDPGDIIAYRRHR